MKKFLIALLMLVITPAYAMTDKQHTNLMYAEAIGEIFHVPEVAAMVLQESSACTDKHGDDGTSFGCLQVSVPAARDVMKYCATARECLGLKFNGSNAELKQHLIKDNGFNMLVGTIYYRIKIKQMHGDRLRALVAYNAGNKVAKSIADPRQHNYVKAINKRIKEIYGPVEEKERGLKKYLF